jgi:hypothetical protein
MGLLCVVYKVMDTMGETVAVTVWCQGCPVDVVFQYCGFLVAVGKVGWYGRDNMNPSYCNNKRLGLVSALFKVYQNSV